MRNRVACRKRLRLKPLLLLIGLTVVAHAQDTKRPVKLVTPLYPTAAIDKGLEGTVIVCFSLDDHGHAIDPMIVSSTNAMFDQPALDATRQSVYVTEAGSSTTCWRYRFRL